ncbi:MAG: D-alanyl-D-alanine carboxypeptidase [Clostridia bacterium]|nr:D-alanyl-D-alanine carboxypeptidase [Clostridia bacterium]
MKRLITVFLSAVLLLSVPLNTYAARVATEYVGADLETPLEENLQANAKVGEKLNINAKSAVLMEHNTGKVLYSSNADEKLAPASITKVMTLILVMEAIEEGKIKLDTKVTASEHAASLGGSQIWLEPGEVMTIDELLKATVIASANDATVALAEAVAGSEETFVELMNKKAQDLGLKNTNFINSYGLDAEGHYTTAYDIAVMSAELIRHKLIREYSTIKMDSLRGGESELVNTNKLIRYYDGCFGLKTGTTGKAGSCLTATAERNGLTLIAVVLGSPSSKERFSGAQKLLDYGFANYTFIDVKAETDEFTPLPVKKGTVKTVMPTAEDGLPLLLKKGEESGITQSYSFSENLTAPIKKGDVIGYVKVYLDEREVGVIPIKAAATVEKLTYFVCLGRLIKGLFTL